MSRGMTTAASDAAQGEVVVRTAAVKLDFDTAPVLVNGSPADVNIAGETYLGVGVLGSISAAEEGAELRAYGMTLTLSGIPNDAIATALTETYQGRAATVWEVLFDTTTWEMIADPVIVFRGRMDQMTVALGETATVTVRLENRLADWERARVRRYTHEDQLVLYPTDRGFEFVAATADKELIWPARSFYG